jgi:hypothetical protein
LKTESWSEEVVREAVWLSGVACSYELAEEILRRIGQLHISRSTIWRCTQAVGAQFQRIEQAERERALNLPQKDEPPSRAVVGDQRMGTALDGALVNIRQEGWKEVKIGSVFEIALSPTPDATTQEIVESAHAVHNSYVAHLGGAEVVGELTFSEARRRGWEQAQETQILGDGAVWIWNPAALHSPKSHQVVDWYHARQHLIDAARLLKQEGTAAFTRWLNHRTTLLYQGHAEHIADELDQAAYGTEAAYFRHNHRRMQYLEMRENGWLIGSGMVESGPKQFMARFAGPGRRWSRTGAENLLPIRSAVLSKRFHDRWAALKNLPPT